METDIVSLVSAFRRGVTHAASKLFQKCLPAARTAARVRLGKNPRVRRWMDSEDVQQEALRKAFAGLGSLDVKESGQFKAWLAEIVENTILDAAKAVHRQRRDVRREHEGAVDFDAIAASVAQAPSPSEVAMGKERAARYFDALASLQPQHRDVILLRKELECSFAEVVRQLGLESEAQARALLSRALGQLAKRMDETEGA